ncbi:MAG TPA: glycosyltransferase family 4 protein [Tepidisphaeraceae bacterium]|nr:glycosyltransferase family 4 protein [Tepidisphaeraceae bacterium]
MPDAVAEIAPPAAATQTARTAREPVFAFLAFTSGSFEGAIIRDMRLANDLHRRGFKVHVYWMMERNPELVDKGIPQTWLVRGLRYQFKKPSGLMDWLGRGLAIIPAQRRRLFINQHPEWIAKLAGNLMRVICDRGRSDPGLLRRLEKRLIADDVTHVLPTFAWTCPIVQRVKERGRAQFDYLPTFQGEEIFAHYAMHIGRLGDYHAALQETVAGSPWPAIAVSRDYIGRLHDEMGIDPNALRPIYPGIELPDESDSQLASRDSQRPADFAALNKIFPSLKPDVPMVTFLGRQDPEKGIDLLLYAARMLAERGRKLQVVCVGGSSFGLQYRKSMEAIAEHLRLHVFWKGRVTNALRAALFRQSRCVVYPSIHREPFGMVAAEAMSYGTPVLVPALGGIQEVIEVDGRRGGLAFRAWDSASLAEQLDRLLTDDVLYAELRAAARPLSELFTVERMTDAVLAHMGLPPRPTSHSK